MELFKLLHLDKIGRFLQLSTQIYNIKTLNFNCSSSKR